MMGGLVSRQVGLGITAVKTDARYVKFWATHNVGCSAVHISLHWRVSSETGGKVGAATHRASSCSASLHALLSCASSKCLANTTYSNRDDIGHCRKLCVMMGYIGVLFILHHFVKLQWDGVEVSAVQGRVRPRSIRG